jgi:hypothetical protein
MKKTFSVIAALFCNSLLARDDAFIRAYDARKYSEAASLIEHVNVSNSDLSYCLTNAPQRLLPGEKLAKIFDF